MVKDHNAVPRPSYQFNELDERLVGIPAVSPFFRSVSGPRAAMFNKHMSQRPVLKKSSEQRIQTGMQMELGKYTYSVVVPDNSYIVARIPKYIRTTGSNFVNPLTTIIYQDTESRQFDIINLPRYRSDHQYFGFEYKINKDVLNMLHPGHVTIGDMTIADSPAKMPDGDYHFGIQANMALMTDPVVIEDGIKISESFAKRLEIDLFESRTIIIRTDQLPLNIYGDSEQYKMFPNIGDKIRPDGIVFSIREGEPMMAPVNMSVKNLMSPNMFDTSIYGKAGAEVIDIEVIKGDTKNSDILTGMHEQLNYHHNQQLRYYKSILDCYNNLAKKYREHLDISHRFHSLVKEAIAVLRSDVNKLIYRSKDRLNGWRVKITYKYSLTAKEAFKLTDLYGGKGVVCAVVPDDQMPINEIGIRADVIMDNQSPYKRTIMSKHQEMYINAALDKVLYDIRLMVDKGDKNTYLDAFNHLMGFYKIVSPPMYDLILNSEFDPYKHVEEVLNGNVALWLPANNPVDYMEVIGLLEQYYPAVRGKVKFKGTDGKLKTSKSDILIGGCYMILLDKIATENAAVSSARTQHFGMPSKLNKNNKNHSAARDQPTKSIAEDDSRTLEATVGGKVTAEILDFTNNPETHKDILEAIYATDKPSSLTNIIDRQKRPTGHGYVQNMVNNILNCAGLEFVPAPEGVD